MINGILQKFEGNLQANLSVKKLSKLILKLEKSYKTKKGAIGTFTGERTSRSPKDRFMVKDKRTEKNVYWGEYNVGISQEKFDKIAHEIGNYLSERTVYSVDCVAGQDDSERIDLTVFTELPSQAMFSKIMFRDVTENKIKDFKREYVILSAPELKLDAKKLGIYSSAFIGIDVTRKIILVAGTGYVCEIKKAIFSVFNFEKPQKGVLTMHCSCNCDEKGANSALFFGLSGTGKTTLSNSPGRKVVADDENGWNDNGIFNIEDGCYAKIFELNPENDKDIYQAIRKGALIENVPLDKNGCPNYYDGSITENMRAAYPLKNLKNVIISGKTGIPKNIFFLTADSTGVFPPISKLNPAQIQYYFLNGFTSKMKGAEGKTMEPEWTFSPCFGAPFMPLNMHTYSKLLQKRVKNAKCNVWLVNTGWTGGVFGVGTRIKLKDTRRLVDEAIKSGFSAQGFTDDGYLGLSVPNYCEGLSSNDILKPINVWESKQAYKKQVSKVLKAFEENCKRYDI